jgi:hypothetical protein
VSPAHPVSLEARHSSYVQCHLAALLATRHSKRVASPAGVDVQPEQCRPAVLPEFNAPADVRATTTTGDATVPWPAAAAALWRVDADTVHYADAATAGTPPAAVIVVTGR